MSVNCGLHASRRFGSDAGYFISSNVDTMRELLENSAKSALCLGKLCAAKEKVRNHCAPSEGNGQLRDCCQP